MKDECQVKVDHNGQTFHLLMVVVHEVGTPLLGLQWIREMQLDLNNLIYALNYSQRPIGKIYSQGKLKQILEKHKEVFKEGLGHCTKVQAHIKLKPNAIPKFCKPRQIAFAHLQGVKDEICGDFKVTINPQILVDQHPIPVIDELLTHLSKVNQSELQI